MDPFDALTLEQLRTRQSMKWHRFDPDVLPLWVAEMDVLLADPVREVLVRAVRDGDTGYPGTTPYAEALAAFAEQRWGWSGHDPARTALVADVMTGVAEAVRLVTGPGSTVVVSPPVYPPFFGYLEDTGREVLEAPLGDDGRLDLEGLGEAFERATSGGRAAAYLLCSPHNPTGVVHTAEELTALADLARAAGVRVVADEIHAPLVLDGPGFVPWLSVDPAGLAVTSASKAWNLAGLKAAVLVAGPDAAADLARLPEVATHGPSHLGVLAHTAALQHGGPWLDDVLAALRARRDLLGTLLAEHLPQVSWTPPRATFLAWLDCSGLGLTGPYADAPAPRGVMNADAGPARAFLERSRVGLAAGTAFGAGGLDHVRVTMATSTEVLTEAVTRMARVSG
ncbi:cystathionine beta-lyase [Marmoricola sp. Leaf446]|uniref:MalY/PatB family protein n=1 Tax=Marmoricola sp. Leaf446 TaxID=1736379 RepID=UPI0006FA895B|nr:aminotransferase class I/II-fold pyridoxal phosphate-dependent enzyme [Marmoricola sp. Leaf446]KQT89391.1 cystathionine beta-lyase [Marmoricola sp. Leaf446]